MKNTYFLLLFALSFFSCNTSTSQTANATSPEEATAVSAEPVPSYSASATPSLAESQLDSKLEGYDKAIFASGCFWCTEEVFQHVKGVKGVYSGYVGGEEGIHPTYSSIGTGNTGYAEAVIVYYDPEVISYDLLLEFFYASHDPTQVNRQGPDVGTQYRSGVFYRNPEQAAKATEYQNKLDSSDKYDQPIATEITETGTFYLAEEYHQNYYPQHPENRYIQNVSRPKVEKFKKQYGEYLDKA
jgi:peptide-methionine (S)-S-oxide reductase